jgi:hypothetical protein
MASPATIATATGRNSGRTNASAAAGYGAPLAKPDQPPGPYRSALLLLGEYTPEEMARGVEFSLADSIIQLAYEPREPVDRRWLRVVKQRGSHHLEGKHTFRSNPGGSRSSPASRPSTPNRRRRSPDASTAGSQAWTS